MVYKEKDWEMLPQIHQGVINSWHILKKFLKEEKIVRYSNGWNPLSSKSQIKKIKEYHSKKKEASMEDVKTTKNDPPSLVLWQFQPETKLGPIGHTISLWPIWPPLVLHDLLAISLFPGQIWPQAISCHHWPPWPIPISSTPRPLSLFWAWGLSVS
ncbi:hypothetical protein O181_065589 [Austropuccinia psidii MF-1]|uniref:Uncharacterized protein n=1 Tax=Austropuccinia psidii MF-1 TaxID=1389203 RepID=A0A9Q3ERR6_9BASI|nr:hypothetical protein [Austropuccinia psidii MF-1]